MTHRSSAGRFVVVLALAALGVATVHAGRQTVGQAPPKEVIEQVLVKVNSDIITKTDLETRQSTALRSQKINPRTISDAELSKALADITPQIIVFAVDELLLLQRGRELGFRTSDEEFKKFLERIKKENNIETDEQFVAALKIENMTLADLRLSYEKNGIIQQVQEQEVMRRHPMVAYEMLSPIAYLRPALDIPYCHHERWDGSGYPRGLKGEEIPLAARIFSVVDVWDALSSGRPYRPPWPSEKVTEHLWLERGRHFDPAVVETFLRIPDED